MQPMNLYMRSNLIDKNNGRAMQIYPSWKSKKNILYRDVLE
jgi:uncharacterized protein involved in propanediol utilization